MPNPIEFALLMLGGVALGLLYFGGLWWTIKRCHSSKHPFGVYWLSSAVRTATVLVCLAVIMNWGIAHLLITMGGFLAARLAMTRWISPPVRSSTGAYPGRESWPKPGRG